MKKEYVNIGKRLPRIDGVVKATGEAKFAGDLSLPGTQEEGTLLKVLKFDILQLCRDKQGLTFLDTYTTSLVAE